MKRYLILLLAAWMTFSLVACSSSKNEATPTNSPKAAETSASPKATSTTAAASVSPSESSKATTAPTASDSANAAQTSTPSQQPEKAASPQQTENKPSPAQQAESNPAPTKQQPDSTQANASQPDNAAAPAIAAEEKPAAAPQKEEISAKGKKLLLAGRERAPEDNLVAERFKALGFNVKMIIDRELTADETKGFDLIYISQTVNSRLLKEGIMKNVDIPTVYVKNHGMFYLGLSSIEENANVLNVKTIDIVNPNEKITADLSGTVEIYKEQSSKFGIGYGIPGKEAKVIATAPGDKDKAAIYYYDKGAKADNGYETKARISFFYLNNGLSEQTTDAGWKLLDNLVLWTLQNG